MFFKFTSNNISKFLTKMVEHLEAEGTKLRDKKNNLLLERDDINKNIREAEHKITVNQNLVRKIKGFEN